MVRPLREPTMRMAWLRLRIEIWHLISEIGWAIRNWGEDIIDWCSEESAEPIRLYCIEEEELNKVVDLDEYR